MQRQLYCVLLALLATGVIAYSPPMTTVAGGTISVGTSTPEGPWSPLRTVTVGGFSIANTEVTNADYAAYLNSLPATGLTTESTAPTVLRLFDTTSPFHAKPLIQVSPATGPANVEACQIKDMGVSANPRFVVVATKEAFPVNWVSFYGAKAFAKKYNMDLPTVPEWETAAGTATYAIGSTVTCGTTAICGAASPGSVTSTANSASANGVKGLVGNVAEWTTDTEGNMNINNMMSTTPNPLNNLGYDANKAASSLLRFYNKKVVKGGSFKDSVTSIPASNIHVSYPFGYMGPEVGFRVVLPTAARTEFTGLIEECYPNEHLLQPMLIAGTNQFSIMCGPCDFLCASCSDPGQCLTCQGNSQPSPAGICTCPSGYSLNAQDKCVDSNSCGLHQFWNAGTCTECDQLCKTCANTSSACTSCPPNTISVGTSGCQCAPGFMQTPQGCLPDGSGIACAHGYFKVATGCGMCAPSCRNCSGGTEKNCLSCWPEANLVSNQCVCHSDFVMDAAGKCIVPQMISVTGGSISVGTGTWQDLWAPQRNVNIDNFSMSINEITNSEYAAYLNSLPATSLTTDPAAPTVLRLFDTTSPFHTKPLIQVSPATAPVDPSACQIKDMGITANPRFVVVPGKEAFPVNWVSFYGAKAFAKRFNMDLPTVPEWEAAAGTATYAIGNTVACGTNAICGVSAPGPVSANGGSSSGIKGLAGNVAEWTADNEGSMIINEMMSLATNPWNNVGYDAGKTPVTLQKFYNKKVVKGGSFKDSATTLTETRKHQSYPLGYMGPEVGFRVVSPPVRTEFTGLIEECYPNEHQLQPMLIPGTHQFSITCGPCDMFCASCSGPAQCLSCPGNSQPTPAGICDICPSGYSLNAVNKCVDSNSCGLHQFWNAGTCTECDQLCKTCANTFSSCTSCPPNAISVGTSGCQCAPGFMQTPQGCLPDGSGIACAHGYFKAATGCGVCAPSCRNCNGAMNNNCLSCWPNANLVSNQCTCLANFVLDAVGKCICPAGKFVNPTNNNCEPCGLMCKTCSNAAAECLSCNYGMIVMGAVCVCPLGMTQALTTDNCAPPAGSCYPTCATCFGPQPTNCLTCGGTVMTLQSDGSCDCPPGQFYMATISPAVCQPCMISCVRCSGPAASQCTKCPPHGTLQTDGTCKCDLFYIMDASGSCTPQSSSAVCPVPNTFMKDDGACGVCDGSCRTCLGPLPSHCMTCWDPAMLQSLEPGRFNFGYCKCGEKMYMPPGYGACEPCHGSCRTCTGGSATQCIDCAVGLIYSLASNQCLCPTPLTYQDGACVTMPAAGSTCLYFQYGGSCTNCKPPCSSCSSDTACTGCAPPRFLDAGNSKCVCGSGYFSDPWGACQRCDQSCVTCSGPGPNNCLTCSPFRTLDAVFACKCNPSVSQLSVESKTCIVTGKVCAAGLYKNEKGNCVACHSSCKECVGPTLRECVQCNAPAHLYTVVSPLFGICQCGVGFSYDYANNACFMCHSSCGDCNGPKSFECIACGANANLVKTILGQECQCNVGMTRDATGQCFAAATGSCPPRTFMTPTSTTCQSCAPSCLSCQGTATFCTSCVFPQVLSASLCLCPAGMYRLSTTIATMVAACVEIPDVNCKEFNGQTCVKCFETAFLDSTGMCKCVVGSTADVSGECVFLGTSMVCLPNLYFNAYDQSCQPCHQSCLSCNGSLSNNCATCHVGRVLSPDGLCKCADGLFQGGDGGCYQCITGCWQCSGPSVTECYTCFPGMVMSPAGGCQCVDNNMEWAQNVKSCTPLRHSFECAVNQYITYPTTAGTTAGFCSLCNPACSSCVGPNSDQCIACVPGLTKQPPSATATATVLMFKGVAVGVCSCGFAQVMVAGACMNCTPMCATCQGVMTTECFVCVENAVMNNGFCNCKIGYQWMATIKRCVVQSSDPNCDYAPKMFSTSPTLPCTACMGKCLSCTSATACTVCDPSLGFDLADATCGTCRSGFYMTVGGCQACDVTCSVCVATSCTTCLSATSMSPQVGSNLCTCNVGLYWNANSKQCLPTGTCPAGTYVSGTTCLPCIATCASCFGPSMSECTTCIAPLVFMNGGCQCTDGLYMDTVSKVCVACGPTCKRCQGTADVCLECAPGFLINMNATVTNSTATGGMMSFRCRCPINMDLIGANCMAKLDPNCATVGMFWSGTSCVACLTPCASCAVINNNCLSCVSGFMPNEKPDNTVNCHCPYAKFLSAPGVCTPCVLGCVECFGPAMLDCTRCNWGLTYTATGCQCPTGSTLSLVGDRCEAAVDVTCGIGRYPGTTGCLNCDSSCSKCTGSANTQCSACDPNRGLVLAGNSCVCGAGMYTPAGTTFIQCQKCDWTCATCSGDSKTNCLTCGVQRTLVSGKCVCASTAFADGEKCYSITAVATCGAGKFMDDDGICKKCNLACATCVGPFNSHCLTCTAPLQPNPSYLPFLTHCSCPTHYYWTESGCALCHEKCKECFGPSDKQCNACAENANYVQMAAGTACECRSGFMWSLTGGVCVPVPTATGCKDSTGIVVVDATGKYMKADGSCGACDVTCWTCLGPNTYDCATCKSGAYLKSYFDTVSNQMDSSKGSCLCYEYGQYRTVAGGCAQCLPNCSKCTDLTAISCTECGYFSHLTASGCICNSGTLPDASGWCQPQGTSTNCPYYNYLEATTNACKQCHSNCLTCSGALATQCVSCRPYQTLALDNSCKCTSGYYLSFTSSDGYQSCSQCFETCQTCSGPGHDQCLSCNSPTGTPTPPPIYALVSGKCECVTGKYYSPKLKTCRDIDPTLVGKYVVDAGGNTQPCHPSCVNCLGSSNNDCTSCGAGAIFQLVSGMMTQQQTGTATAPLATNTTAFIFNFNRGYCYCDFNNFPDFSGRCFKCNETCAGCYGPSAFDCFSCKLGFVEILSAAGSMCGCPVNMKLNSTGGCSPMSLFSGCSANQYADSTGACKPCAPFCSSCVGPNNNQCATCFPGARLNATSIGTISYGNCLCNTTQYLDTTVSPPMCLQCNQLCVTCRGPSELDCDSCTATRDMTTTSTGGKKCACKTGYKEDAVTGTCNPISGSTTCPYNSYMSTTGTCSLCDPSCVSCTSAGPFSCLSCNVAMGLTLYQSTGFIFGTCKCGPSQFLATDGSCQKCHPSCQACSGSTDTQCQTCWPNSVLTSGKCLCATGTIFDLAVSRCLSVSACAAGYFKDDSGACSNQCSPLCSTCAGPGPQRCGTCAATYVPKQTPDIPGLTTCLCPQNTFFNNTSGACVQCDSTCGNCQGPEPFKCLDCPNGRVLNITLFGQECICAPGYTISSQGCVPKGSSQFCPSSQFQDATGACKPCEATCLTCVGPLATDCMVCGLNSVHPSAASTVGACVCLPRFYISGSVCMPCMPSCASCTSATACTSCNSDRVLSSNVCVCQAGWTEVSGKCTPTATSAACQVNQYLDLTLCKDCSTQCVTCKGATLSDCSSCDYGSNKQLNVLDTTRITGRCVCKPGFFQDTTSVNCIPCDPACKDCSGLNNYQCVSCHVNSVLATTATGQMCTCISGFAWSVYTKKCESAAACPSGKYLAGAVSGALDCQLCHNSCSTCKGPGVIDCIACKAGMTMLNAVCVCPDGMFNSGGACSQCDITCQKCHGPTQLDCDACKPNASFQTATLATAQYKSCSCNTNYHLTGVASGWAGTQCTPMSFTTCPNASQYLKADGTCATCHSFCGACNNNGREFCYYCAAGPYHFTQLEMINGFAVGRCDCAPGFVYQTGSCVACDTSCAECNSILPSGCTVCAQYRAFANGLCACAFNTVGCVPPATGLCSFGFFSSGTTCQPCIPDCESCIGPSASECVSCRSQDRKALIKMGAGISGFCQCISGFYMDSGLCRPCDLTCTSCSGPGVGDCLSCNQGAVPMTPGTASPCVCQSSLYVLSPVTRTCIKMCTTDPLKQPDCTSPCQLPCQSCIGPNSNECLACVTPFMPIQQPGTSAVKCACPHNTWVDGNAATIATSCLPCHTSCAACYGPGAEQCTSCPPHSSLTFTGTTSSCQCESGYSRSTAGSCVPQGTSAVCPSDKYLDAAGGSSCLPCSVACLTCYGPGDFACQLCPVNAMLTTAGSCKCQPGFFSISTAASFSCVVCAGNCMECAGSATSCTKCDGWSMLTGSNCACVSPYVADATGKCKPSVTIGCTYPNQFKNSAGFCSDCDFSCETCAGPGNMACKSCYPFMNMRLLPTNTTVAFGSCICADGFVGLGVGTACVPCDRSCRTCSGPSYQSCLTCPMGAVLNTVIKACDCMPTYFWSDYVQKCISVTACNSGFWMSDTTCQPCAKTCKSCLGPGPFECLTCPDGMVGSNSNQKAGIQMVFCTCPNGQYLDEVLGKCASCQQKCATCYGSTEFQCLSCPANSELDYSIASQSPCKCLANFKRDATTQACSPVAIFPDCALSEFKNAAGACAACDPSCLSCFDGNPQSCANCPPGANFMVLSPATSTMIFGKCMCQPGSVFVSGKCVSCAPGCSTCFGASTTQCLSCQPNFAFTSGACLCSPPFVMNGNICNPVSTSALCSVSQFMSTTGQCLPCDYSCVTCVGPTQFDCVACPVDQRKVLQPAVTGATSGQCVCGAGTFVSNGQCIPCDSTCKTCSGSAPNNCVTCALVSMAFSGGVCTCPSSGTWAPVQGTCVTPCSGNTFLGSSGTCMNCDPACGGCKGPGPDQCLNCVAGGGFVASANAANPALVVCKCPAGTYFTGTVCAACTATKCAECVSGPENCTRCADPNMTIVNVSGKNTCSCTAGYNLVGNVCVAVNQYGCINANAYKDATGTCVNCDSSCATCSGGSKYECVFCKAGAVRAASPVGACNCPVGTFTLVDYSCSPCVAPCLACTASTCLTCPLGQFPAFASCGTCVPTCKSCKDATATGCTSCHTNALLNAAGSCLCQDGYVLATTGPGCVAAVLNTVCTTGQFLDTTGKCVSCHSSCLTCTGPFATNCVACQPGTNTVLSKMSTSGTLNVGSCVCADNSFLDTATTKCMPCDSTCLTCSGSGPERCLTCPATVSTAVTTSSGKKCPCATNYLYSPYTKKCEAASAFSTGLWLDANLQTQKCHYSCTQCIGPTAGECILCGGVRVKDPAALATSMIWRCVCTSGFEQAGGDCGVCTGLCATCQSADPANCLSCKVNSMIGGPAVPSKCVCNANYNPDPAGVNCTPVLFDTSCAVSQYKNAAGTCTSCHPSCGSCVGGTDSDCLTCTSSTPNFKPMSTATPVTGKCLCSAGFRWTGTSCAACIAGCMECVDGSTCSKCATQFVLTGTTCACPAGYTLVGTNCNPATVATCSGAAGLYNSTPTAATATCLPCHATCLNCVGPLYTDCLSCKDLSSRLTIITVNNNSGSCGCPNGTFLASGACQPCGPKCATCANVATSCITCKTGYNLVNSDCVCASGVFDSAKNACVNTSLCAAGNYPNPPDTTNLANCVACVAPCLTCVGGSNKMCVTCPTPMTPVSTGTGTFECRCPVNFFYNPTTNACVACSPTCLGCSGSATGCLACTPGTFRNFLATGLTGTCPCNLGYNDVAGQCTPVTSGTCTVGQWNNSGTCAACHVTCQSCTAASDASCLICKTADMKQVDTDSNTANGVKCVCADGSFWNGSNCSPCAPSCSLCSPTACTVCKVGNSLTATGTCVCNFNFLPQTDGTCLAPTGPGGCKFNQYLPIGSTTCASCDSSCFSCSGPSPGQCTQCGQNAAFDSNKLCTCNNGFYYSLATFMCVSCDASCLTCKGPGTTSCLTCVLNKYVDATSACVCNPGFTLSSGVCQLITAPGCQANQYLVGITCTNCNLACANCNGALDTNCLVCAQGYTKNAAGACVCSGFLSGTMCIACDYRCLTCSVTASQCITCPSTATLTGSSCMCKSGYYWDVSTNKCMLIPSCQAKSYFDTNQRTCLPCYFTCATCSGPTFDTCLTCVSGATGTAVASGTSCLCNSGMYYNKVQNMCVTIPTCISGQFLDTVDYVCKACDVSCKECKSNSPAGCSSCNTGLTLWTTGECRCAEGFFLDRATGKCQVCDSSCSSCSGPGSAMCGKCGVGYFMRATGGCACDLANGYYQLATGECKPCNAACKSCAGIANDQCTTCKPRSVLVVATLGVSTSGVCVCDMASYFDQKANACVQNPCVGSTYVSISPMGFATCEKCPVSCLTCSDKTETSCTQCPANRQFIKNNVPSTYTGPITGACKCMTAFIDPVDPTKCNQAVCPDGFFFDNSISGMAAVCSVCDPNCVTCIGKGSYDCKTCAINRLPADQPGYFKTKCNCNPAYQYPDGTCGTTMYVNATSGCPLNQNLCQTARCSFSTGGGLLPPVTDDCLRSLYDYCCFSTGLSQCAGLGVTFDKCSEVAPPTVSSARFSDDGLKVIVQFSAVVNFLVSDCSAIFRNQTVLSTSTCQVPFNQSALIIILAPDHKLVPSGVTQPSTSTTQSNINLMSTSVLTIQPGVYRSSHKWASGTNPSSPITVLPPLNSGTAVKLQLTFPSVVSGCQQSIHLDASASTGGGSKPLTFTWVSLSPVTLVIPPGRSDQVDITGVNQPGLLKISLKVTATNLLGKFDSKQIDISVLTGLAPEVSLPFSNITIDSTKDFNVYMQARVPSCSGTTAQQGQITYRWSLNSTTSVIKPNIDFSNTESAKLVIPGKTLSTGQTYVFQGSATIDQVTWGYALLTVIVPNPPLKVSIVGGNRDISTKLSIVLDSSNSFDPLQPESGQIGWTYTWTCEDWTAFGGLNPIYADGVDNNNMEQSALQSYKNFKAATCVDSSNSALMSGLKAANASLSIPASALPPNKILYFKLAAALPTTSSPRSGFSYSYLKTKLVSRSSKTAIRYFGTNLNATGTNTLYCETDCQGCGLQWTVVTPGVTVNWLSTDLTRKDVAFIGDGLKADTVYSFQCTTSQNGESMSAQVDLSLNSPPSGGSFEMTPEGGNVTTQFTATFSNWVDQESNYPLKYILMLNDQGKSSVLRVSDNSRIDGLTFPAGIGKSMHLISSQVCDSLGNCRNSDNRYIRIEQLSAANATSAVDGQLTDYNKNKESMNKQERTGALSSVVQTISATGTAVDPATVTNTLNNVKTECSASNSTDSNVMRQCLDMYKGLANAVNTTSDVSTPVLDLLTSIANSNTPPTTATLNSGLELISNLRNSSARASDATTQTTPDTVDINAMLAKIGDMAMKDKPTSAPVELTSGSLSAKFENKDNTDMVTNGAAFTTPSAVVVDTSTSEGGRRLQTTSTKRYQVTIPPCMVPTTTANSTYRINYWTSSASDYSFPADRNRSSYDSDLTLMDSKGSVLPVKNDTCQDHITICSEFVPPPGFRVPLTGIYNPANGTYGSYSNYTWMANTTEDHNLTLWSFKCQYWDTTKKTWSEDGVMQNLTTIFWSNRTICCKTTHLTTFSSATVYAAPAPYSDHTPLPNPIYSPYTDSFDGWDNFNGFYIGCILALVEIGLVMLGLVLDLVSGKKSGHNLTPTVTTPSNAVQAQEMEKGQAFETPEHKEFEGDVKRIDDHTVPPPGQESPPAQAETLVSASTPNICMFFLYNFFITGYILKYKPTYSRPARAAEMCTILFCELAITGLFSDISRMHHFVIPAIIAVVICLPASPIFALLFYTPRNFSKCAKTVKVALAILTAVLIMFASLGSCAHSADTLSYGEIQYWMKAFGVAVGLELVAAQILKVALKRLAVAISGCSNGCGKVMAEV